MKHFINDRADVVTEAIDATVLLGEGRLARLDGFPSIKVVVRTDWDRAAVAVVSGGGSGHEPSHAGFVGDGMLTAAVCGEVFASPSVDAVLAAILAVTGDAGCLLIVKNYTGDRLNFGLAAEKARALGLDVETVIVADDIALVGQKEPATRPRGLAGTLFVHKVAGHLARAGAPLAAVKAGAERVSASLASIGLALTSCTLHGQVAENRIGPAEVELGLGIHGEPGAETLALREVTELARVLAVRIEDVLEARGAAGSPRALLINDLGAVPPIELAVATGAILGAMRAPPSLVFGPERLMTSLDMKGISLSALPLDDELERALLSPVGPRAWPAGRRPAVVAPVPLGRSIALAETTPSTDPVRRLALERICAALVAMQADLDALDAKVGDGDTGTTFATAARAIAADLDRLPFADAPGLCAALSDRLSKAMGGSSGALSAIFVAAVGASMRGEPSWPSALRAGIHRVEEYGGAREGDRTMLDALIPAVATLEAGGDLAAAAVSARRGADRTRAMTRANAGRAAYVPGDKLAGVTDPGAAAIAGVFEALSRA